MYLSYFLSTVRIFMRRRIVIFKCFDVIKHKSNKF